jgi:hypothetical protein
MTDVLFIELGAVVTGTLGLAQCNIEPLCASNAVPTYNDPTKWYLVDFAQSLDNLGNENALYDQIISPNTVSRVPIGPSWPGGGHEGILCIRHDTVLSIPLLRDAAATLAGPRCRYQVIVSIGPGGAVQRYHGFPAEELQYNDDKIAFNVGKCSGIVYDPSDPQITSKFYTGNLVPENLVTTRPAQGPAPVFINVAAFPQFQLGDELPKLPPSAGL